MKNKELISLYKEIGADLIIENQPVTRIKRVKTKDDESEKNSFDDIENLRKIKSIEGLKDYIEKFKYSDLSKTANKCVFSDGNPESKVMLIGEAPGREEDKQGLPFVGRAGKLLDKMLEAIQLERKKDVYITNIVNWRPPNNRTPTEKEILLFLPMVKKHIELINPRIILLLGATSVKAMLGRDFSISKIRGKWQTCKIGKLEIPTLPTYHPAFLLRQPAQKKFSWEDLKSLKKKINEIEEKK